jgi:hypothetical protein
MEEDKKQEESKGLGDTIDKITTATGIKSVVNTVTKAVGVKDCGCNKRRQTLNNLFPYNKK